MNKKSINNQYNIKYDYPESKEKPTKYRKNLLLPIFLFLTIPSLVLGLLFAYGNLADYFEKDEIYIKPNIASTNAENELPIAKLIEKPVITPSVTPVASNEKNTIKEPQPKNVQTKNVQTKNTNNSDILSSDYISPISEKQNENNEEISAITTQNIAKSDPPIESNNENNALLSSLKELTEELIEQRKKNEELETQLKNSKNDNNITLLLNRISNETKQQNTDYLSALEEVDKDKETKLHLASNNTANEKDIGLSNTDSKIILIDKKAVLLDKKIADSKIATAQESSKEPIIDYNNAVNLSMQKQIDAIIQTMKKDASLKSKNQVVKIKVTTEVNTISKATTDTNDNELETENDDLISQLNKQLESSSDSNTIQSNYQKEINQLSNLNDSSSSSYRTALNNEATERKNAIRSIVVKKGETLWGIAKRAYGDGKYYKKILKANPQLLRRGVLRLNVGQVIRVPI